MHMHLNHLILMAARKLISTGKKIKSEKWQGVELTNPMYEAIKVYLGPAQMPAFVTEAQTQCKPNMPWAEDHFKERMSGEPLNPGNQYKNWPFYRQDDKMRNVEQKGATTDGDKKFSHTYMERFWPKCAGDFDMKKPFPNKGIRYEYGDLLDVIKLLVDDPHTRQAYLPIFFPEDTGAVHGGRVPCTLGYLFQIRDNYLHVTYHIRSCDFIRHFRDDIYMTVRLVQEMVLQLKLIDPDGRFEKLVPGLFDMHIGSLHIFNAEVNKVKKEFEIV